MSGGPRTRKLLVVAILAVGLAAFVWWRFTGKIHTYGIGDSFALPIEAVTPAGLADLRASTCGGCHVAIYEEWRASVHAAAWTDEYFQVDWAHDGKEQNCLNCHTPMRDQQEQLVTGFEGGDRWRPVLAPNPDFDAAFREEGVTCVVCHLRDGVLVGPRGSDVAPHPTGADPTMLSGFGVCARCHIAPPVASLGGALSVCTTLEDIDTRTNAPDCVGCHMDPVERPLMVGFPVRKGRTHTFRGGHSAERVAGALELAVEQAGRADGRLTARVRVENVGTPHTLPSGMPDRHIVVVAQVLDRDGVEVERVEQKYVRRILWRPFIYEMWDSRLRLNEPDFLEIDADVDGAGAPYTVEVSAEYGFLEPWRRRSIGLPETSHANAAIGAVTHVVP